MASEYYDREAELSITDSEDDKQQIANRNHFHDISIGEIVVKEEPTDIKPFIYRKKKKECFNNRGELLKEQPTKIKSFNKYEQNYESPLEHSEEEPDSAKVQFMPRESEEDPIESKFSPTYVGKYINSNVDGSAYGLVDEQENSVDNQGVEIKNDDDIDIVYEDVKPEIFGETSGGKSIHKSYSNSNDDILMGPSSPHELAIDVCKYMNSDVDGSEIGLEDEQENLEVIQFNKGVEIKNENQDYSECSGDFLINYAGLETKTLKTDNDIDIIYEDIKPEIFQEKSGGKINHKFYSNSNDDILMGTIKMGASSPDKLAIDLNMTSEEGVTDVKRDVTRKTHTITYNSNNSRSKKEANRGINERIGTRDKPLKFKICSISFSHKSVLNLHERVHTGGKQFQCEICSKSLSSKQSLENHARVHAGGKQFQCEICSKSLASKRSLENHARVCFKSFADKSNLLAHERIHTKEKSFQSEICSESFIQKSRFIVHERVHKVENPFHCKMKQSLENYAKVHAGEKPFECKMCFKSFADKSNLLSHVRIHTREKSFQSKICSESFIQKSRFIVHERVHKEENPFHCKICSKSLSSKQRLEEHMRIHTGKNPFQCNICLRSFASKQNLVAHERYHKCNICSTTFVNKRALINHESIHTGEKPFQCKICSKSFIYNTSLIYHERTHSGEKPFE